MRRGRQAKGLSVRRWCQLLRVCAALIATKSKDALKIWRDIVVVSLWREQLQCSTRQGCSQQVRRAQILLKADADGPAWTDQQIADAYVAVADRRECS